MGKWEKRGRYPWLVSSNGWEIIQTAGLRWFFFAAKNKLPWLAGSALPADAGVVVAPCGMENPCNLEASWLCWGWWRCGWWLWWCWCRVSFRLQMTRIHGFSQVSRLYQLERWGWIRPAPWKANHARQGSPGAPHDVVNEIGISILWWCTSCDQPKMYQFLVLHVSKIYSYLSHRSHDPGGEVLPSI